MVPHPEDDWTTVKETENFMNELKNIGASIYVSFATPFPGTTLYKNNRELGIELISDDTDEYNLATPVIQTKNFSVEDISKIFERFIMISKDTIPFDKI